MKKKKLLEILLVALSIIYIICACSEADINSEDPSLKKKGFEEDGVEIEVFNLTRMSVEGVIQEIANNFARDNPDIKLVYSQSSNEYENIMKIRMASHNMPDVFGTHGWAIKRYGEFLADLSGEDWSSRVKDSMKPFVMDEKGKLYVLPIDEDRTGIVFNVDVLKRFEVDIPATFDDMVKACEKIKAKSDGTIIPMYISGDDSGQVGNFYNYFSISLFISPKENYAEDFLNGKFDWTKYDILSEKLLELKNRGLVNKDILTARYYDLIDAFSDGKVAFVGMHPPSIVSEAKKRNPNIHAGIMPIPAMVEGDEPYFACGERTTWGVWKDSPNINEAKRFVSYFAKPENIKKVAEANGVPAGLTGINEDLGELAYYYNIFKDKRCFNYFDREYLPSGMWDVMCNNGQDLLAGVITPRQYSQKMEMEYSRLRNQR